MTRAAKARRDPARDRAIREQEEAKAEQLAPHIQRVSVRDDAGVVLRGPRTVVRHGRAEVTNVVWLLAVRQAKRAGATPLITEEHVEAPCVSFSRSAQDRRAGSLPLARFGFAKRTGMSDEGIALGPVRRLPAPVIRIQARPSSRAFALSGHVHVAPPRNSVRGGNAGGRAVTGASVTRRDGHAFQPIGRDAKARCCVLGAGGSRRSNKGGRRERAAAADRHGYRAAVCAR